MLKSKIFIVVFMILIILVTFSVSSSALTYTNTEGEKLDFGAIELYDYFVICDCLGVEYRIYTFNKEPYYSYSGKVNVLKPVENSEFIQYVFNHDTLELLVTDEDVPSSVSVGVDGSYLIYNNFDIKNSSGEVVFTQPTLTLGEVLEIWNPVQTYQITMSGIIVSLIWR